MLKLKIEDIIKLIRKGETFEAEENDGSFGIKINRYVPYVCMAIHDGGTLRNELKSKIAVDEFERWQEEDPHTGNFIDSLPITLIGHDSRYEYDLNRNPEECIHQIAWEKKVWKTKLSSKEIQQSKKKHSNFYKVVKALIQKLNEQFGASIIYDIHSYNTSRWERDIPLFNIGTENIDQHRYEKFIHHWQNELQAIQLPEIQTQANINDVFFGRGYCLQFITENCPNTLVLATEIKKVYCNENSGEEFPEIITRLKQSFKEAILNNALYFSTEVTNWNPVKSAHLLDKKEDKELKKIDTKLFRLLKGFELLAYVNPINIDVVKRSFIRSKFTKLPSFKYAPIRIDPYKLKQELSALPTYQISDVSIRNLYEDVISSYFDKIDLLASLNTKKFQYNSLRYFGRPSRKDILNANYILHLPPILSEPKRVPNIDSTEAMSLFKDGLKNYTIDCKIELSNRVISQVMVLNSKNTILIRPDAKFSLKEANALIEHEIGVHMVTTQNSKNQDLKIFNIGLPVNTLTQEGIAILAEYLSGNLTLARLKKLAMRVIIADMMCNGANFIECFNYLTQHLLLNTNEAFTIVTRVFRGGGFTKDYLYLSGFIQALKHWKSGKSMLPLLVGKASLKYYDTIEEMIDRDMIKSPKFVTKSFERSSEKPKDPIYEYILSGLK